MVPNQIATSPVYINVLTYGIPAYRSTKTKRKRDAREEEEKRVADKLSKIKKIFFEKFQTGLGEIA